MQLTMMTKGGVQVYLELIFIKELIMSRRMTASTALHTTEVLRPSCSTGIFLQPLLLCPPTEIITMISIVINNDLIADRFKKFCYEQIDIR